MIRSDAPAIRARWPQRVLVWWTDHAPAELTQALACCTPGLATAIDAVSPTDWIDLAVHCELIGALRQRCGPEHFARKYVLASDHALRMPLFESMIRPLVRIAGRRALLRGFPRGWGMIMHGCGDVEVARTETRGSTDVCFTAVPLAVAANHAYRESVAGVLEALMERGGFAGTVVLDASGAVHGELRYRLTSAPT